ncbi:MAG: DUF433 domain-containing protein [Caldilinea sp. CFX5]|nr:DUF433 domain-containing protein [Caldilinea sp. CFX5]
MAITTTRYQDRIVINPEIMVGKPVIKGTRIPVELVLKRLSQDLNLETLFAAYPRLTLEDVKACLAYAEAVVEGEEIYHCNPSQNPRSARLLMGW